MGRHVGGGNPFGAEIDLAELAAAVSGLIPTAIPVPVAEGGTASATAAGARESFDLLASYVQIQDTVISAAQILLLDGGGGQIDIVTAPPGGPPGGLIAVPILFQIMLDFGTVPFDDAAALGDIRIGYAGGNTLAVVEAAGLIDAVADSHLLAVLAMASPQMTAPAAAAIQIGNDGANFTGAGDSVLRVRAHYRVMPLVPS